MEPIRLCKVIKNIQQNKALCGSWPPHPHRVSAFRSFQPEFPVTARPSRSRQKQTIDPGTRHRFTPNIGTDHHGWNGEAFPCWIVSISWHLVFCIFFFFWGGGGGGLIDWPRLPSGVLHHSRDFLGSDVSLGSQCGCHLRLFIECVCVWSTKSSNHAGLLCCSKL